MLISLWKAARLWEREAKIIFSAINGFSHVVFITPTGMCAELLHVYFVSFHSLSHSTEYNVKHFSTTLVKTTIAAIPLTMKRLWSLKMRFFKALFSSFIFLFVCAWNEHRRKIDQRWLHWLSWTASAISNKFSVFISSFTQQTHIWRKQEAKIRLKNLFIGNETASQHETLQLVRKKQRLDEKVLSGIFLIHREMMANKRVTAWEGKLKTNFEASVKNYINQLLIFAVSLSDFHTFQVPHIARHSAGLRFFVFCFSSTPL